MCEWTFNSRNHHGKLHSKHLNTLEAIAHPSLPASLPASLPPLPYLGECNLFV